MHSGFLRITAVAMTLGLVSLLGCVVFDESLLSKDGGPDVGRDTPDQPDATDDTGVDVVQDALSDVLSDVPTDTGSDVPTDTGQDAPPPPAPACVSYDHDGIPGPSYFYPGAANENCTTVCMTHGGYANTTKTAVGSMGETACCTIVLQTMYNTTASASDGTSSAGVGCARLTDGTLKRYTSPATNETSKISNVQRVCACVQNDSCQQITSGPCI